MFEYTLQLSKAEGADGRLLIEGIASTTDMDLQRDRMTLSALESMAKSALGAPIVTSHNAEAKDVVGQVVDASVDPARGAFVIKAELDEDDVEAKRIYSKLRKNYKMGLSIGGKALVSRGSGSTTINAVDLDHIMITRKPVNTQTCLSVALSKALTEAEDVTHFSEELQPEIRDSLTSIIAKAIRGSYEFLAKAVNPTAEQREQHATYFDEENGKKVGKFPIWDTASAESALHLLGHAPQDQQKLVLAKACDTLGPDSGHPACEAYFKEKNTVEKAELEKAGARLSQASVDALHDIHASSNDPDAVRSKVQDLLGDSFDPAAGSNGDSDDAGDEAVADGSATDDSTVGVANDGDPLSDMNKALITAAADAIAKSVREELTALNKTDNTPQVKDEYARELDFVSRISATL